jgi:hypothetical protein
MKIYHTILKKYFGDTTFLKSCGVGFLLLFLSFIVNFYAGIYATESASNHVNDIILSNIPVFDVDTIFIYGPLVLWVIVTFLCLSEPKYSPFVLKSIALFIVIRSVFMTLTHIGPFPDQIVLNYSDLIGKFTFGGDLFFSAHTGLPFLMALIFRENKKLLIFFTITALLLY